MGIAYLNIWSYVPFLRFYFRAFVFFPFQVGKTRFFAKQINFALGKYSNQCKKTLPTFYILQSIDKK